LSSSAGCRDGVDAATAGVGTSDKGGCRGATDSTPDECTAEARSIDDSGAQSSTMVTAATRRARTRSSRGGRCSTGSTALAAGASREVDTAGA
jgi:hypothetical protein